MKSIPLVSIIIPTYNSAHSLSLCLSAVFAQSYPSIEVIIVDSYSKDETLTIIKKFKKCKHFLYRDCLLGSRIYGLSKSKGIYSLLLDSDQILSKNAVKKCVEMSVVGRKDMLSLEEGVYEVKTFLQWLFYCDRKVIETVKDLDPMTSAILPRFFRRKVLLDAIRLIPKSIIPTVGGPDHAILYYEAWNLSKNIAIVPRAVSHMETDSLIKLMKKCYRWGYTSESSKTILKYAHLMRNKERFRKKLFQNGMIIESIGSILLLLLKGAPYMIGYTTARISKKIKSILSY